MSATGVPSSTSNTTGPSAPPVTVTSVDPAASGDPSWPEPFRSVAGDEGYLGHRLRVVDQHVPPGQSEGHRLVHPHGGQTGATAQPIDEGRLLAGHVPARRAPDRDGEMIRPGPASLLDGRLDRGGDMGVVVGDADDDLRRAQYGGRHLGAVEHHVGTASQKHPVLGTGRLALEGVHHDDRTPGSPPARLPFGGRREAGPAPSEQARGGDRTVNGRAPARIAVPNGERAVHGQMGMEVSAPIHRGADGRRWRWCSSGGLLEW